MKKKILITIIGSISLLLPVIGCKKTVENEEHTSQTEIELNVIERWQDLLEKDNLTLKGNLSLKLTTGDSEKDIQLGINEVQTEVRKFQFSKNKFYSGIDNDIGNDTYLVKLDSGKTGVVGLTAKNEAGVSSYSNDIFDETFKNPFIGHADSGYKLVEDNKNSFTLVDNNEIDTLTQNLTFGLFKNSYPMTFNTLVFTEVDSKLTLAINGQGSWKASKNLDINGTASLLLDVETETADIDYSTRYAPLNETTGSQKLQAALDKMKALTSYKITSILDFNGEESPDGVYTYDKNGMWDSTPSNGQTFGITKDRDDKYYMFYADSNMKKDFVKQYQDGTSAEVPYEDESYAWNYKPVYDVESKIFVEKQVPVLDANGDPVKDSDNNPKLQTEYHVSNDLLLTGSQYLTHAFGASYLDTMTILGQKWGVGSVGYIGANPVITLTDDGYFDTLTFNIVNPTTGTPAGVSYQYKYSNFKTDNTEVIDFKEKVSQDILGEFELKGDGTSSDDEWKKDGLTIKLEKNVDGSPKVTLTKGGTAVTTSDQDVYNGEVTFKVGETLCTYKMDEDGNVSLTIGDKTYNLSEVGVDTDISSAQTEINKVDSNDFKSVARDGEDKSDKAQIEELKTEYSDSISKATSKKQVALLLSEFQSKVNAIDTKEAIEDCLASIDSFINLYDETNVNRWTFKDGSKGSDKDKINNFINSIGDGKGHSIIDLIKASESGEEVVGYFNTIGTLIGQNQDSLPTMTKKEKEDKISEYKASIGSLDLDTEYPNLKQNDKNMLSAALQTLKDALNSTTSILDEKLDAIETWEQILTSITCVIPEPLQGEFDATKVSDSTKTTFNVNGYSITLGSEVINEFTVLDDGSSILFTSTTSKQYKYYKDATTGELHLVEVDQTGTPITDGESYTLEQHGLSDKKTAATSEVNALDLSKFANLVCYFQGDDDATKAQTTDSAYVAQLKAQALTDISNAHSISDVEKIVNDLKAELLKVAKKYALAMYYTVTNSYDDTFARWSFSDGTTATDKDVVFLTNNLSSDFISVYNNTATDYKTLLDALDTFTSGITNVAQQYKISTISVMNQYINYIVQKYGAYTLDNISTQLGVDLTDEDKTLILNLIQSMNSAISNSRNKSVGQAFYYAQNYEYMLADGTHYIAGVYDFMPEGLRGQFNATSTGNVDLGIVVDGYSITITPSGGAPTTIKSTANLTVSTSGTDDAPIYTVRFEYDGKTWDLKVEGDSITMTQVVDDGSTPIVYTLTAVSSGD